MYFTDIGYITIIIEILYTKIVINYLFFHYLLLRIFVINNIIIINIIDIGINIDNIFISIFLLLSKSKYGILLENVLIPNICTIYKIILMLHL